MRTKVERRPSRVQSSAREVELRVHRSRFTADTDAKRLRRQTARAMILRSRGSRSWIHIRHVLSMEIINCVLLRRGTSPKSSSSAAGLANAFNDLYDPRPYTQSRTHAQPDPPSQQHRLDHSFEAKAELYLRLFMRSCLNRFLRSIAVTPHPSARGIDTVPSTLAPRVNLRLAPASVPRLSSGAAKPVAERSADRPVALRDILAVWLQLSLRVRAPVGSAPLAHGPA